MLAANNLSAGYEAGPLFENAEFTLQPGDRLGIVGPNGAGKSTLLQVLHGSLKPETGSVVTEGTVGYLDQLPEAAEPVIDYFDRMTGGVLAAERELGNLYGRMAEEPDNAAIITQAGELQNFMDDHDGWTVRPRINEVLSRLGVPAEAINREFGALSGGQQSRTLLAGQLIRKPDILLLDEPTNNLDTSGLEWLEDFLSSYPGAVAVVSHDRKFLDRTVTRIIELDGEGGEPNYFEGGYTDYRDESARRLAKLVSDYEAQQKRERKLNSALADLGKLGAGFQSTSHNDHWRRIGKKVDKRRVALEHRIERMKASEVWIEKPEERRSLPLQLSGTSRKGQRLIAATALRLGYDIDYPVLDEVTFSVHGQDRVAIVGDNGQGKTTLLNAIAGETATTQGGKVETFADFDYLSQTKTHTEAKKSDKTVIDWFRNSVGEIYENEAASLLVWFGFDKEQLRQPVNKLSPGEINKLGLLGMTYSGKELLLLDEPTNHLDFDALDVVEHVLGEFKGTLVTVSHDRMFLGNIACNRMLRVANGRITEQEV